MTGCGVPQLTAVLDTVRACATANVPVIADGGIRQSGDIVKALAAGASCVMLGSLLAGLDESPGETILYRGRSFKTVRGMGSLGAMEQGSADRYAQGEVKERMKYVPEGVEGMVPYKGSVADFVYQLTGGLRSGMGYNGARTIGELAARAGFEFPTDKLVERLRGIVLERRHRDPGQKNGAEEHSDGSPAPKPPEDKPRDG